MNLRFSPVYRDKAPVQDWCLDSVFIYTCAGEEKETGKPNETITQGMISAFELRLTIILSGMLWNIVFSLQMADHHTKVKVKNLCYVTARHRRLNLTPMWTRCGLPTAAVRQLGYCFQAMTWLTAPWRSKVCASSKNFKTGQKQSCCMR